MSRLSHSEIHMVHRIRWLRAAVLGANDALALLWQISLAFGIIGIPETRFA